MRELCDGDLYSRPYLFHSTRGLDSPNAIKFCNLRLQADLLDVTSVVTHGRQVSSERSYLGTL
jgi:hypothetical protein